MKDPLQPQHCAEMLSALAAPERLRILRFLSGGPKSVTEIAEAMGTVLVNISHHLNVLHAADFLRRRKQGRFVYYSLRPGVWQTTTPAATTARLDLGCCCLELPATEASTAP
jgi:DNA-binding transcriptional ArsR family regulator